MKSCILHKDIEIESSDEGLLVRAHKLRDKDMNMKKMAAVAVLVGTLAASSSVFAAFEAGMSARAVDTEVRQRLNAGQALSTIAAAAQAAGVSPAVLTSSLILAGADASSVVGALVAAGMTASVVVDTAVLGGSNRTDMVRVATDNGADPTTLNAATAAGPGNNQGQGTGPASNSPGATASNFGQSRAATVGGGGRTSVSGS